MFSVNLDGLIAGTRTIVCTTPEATDQDVSCHPSPPAADVLCVCGTTTSKH